MTKKVICPKFNICPDEFCTHRKLHKKGKECINRCYHSIATEMSVGECIPMSRLKYELLK